MGIMRLHLSYTHLYMIWWSCLSVSQSISLRYIISGLEFLFEYQINVVVQENKWSVCQRYFSIEHKLQIYIN